MNDELGQFSYTELFLNAHLGVKVVMGLLILASVYSWAIIIGRWFAIRYAKKHAKKFERLFWSGQTLEQIQNIIAKRKGGAHALIFKSAVKEWRYFEKNKLQNSENLEKRVTRVMEVAITQIATKMSRRLFSLATIGSVAPFVGLLGTVWGIMSSFRSIAATRNTDISVVAPGIAEALFATALGLFAAIPAVMAYNKFTHEINQLIARYENFANEFIAIMSRMFDEKIITESDNGVISDTNTSRVRRYAANSPIISHKGEAKITGVYGENSAMLAGKNARMQKSIDDDIEHIEQNEAEEQTGWSLEIDEKTKKSTSAFRLAKSAKTKKNIKENNGVTAKSKLELFGTRKKIDKKKSGQADDNKNAPEYASAKEYRQTAQPFGSSSWSLKP